MICPRCGAEGAKKNGAGRCYCGACGKFGVLKPPTLNQPDNLPEGVKLRGTSTLTDIRTGETVMQWVKTTADEAQREAGKADAFVDPGALPALLAESRAAFEQALTKARKTAK